MEMKFSNINYVAFTKVKLMHDWFKCVLILSENSNIKGKTNTGRSNRRAVLLSQSGMFENSRLGMLYWIQHPFSSTGDHPQDPQNMPNFEEDTTAIISGVLKWSSGERFQRVV